MYRELLPFPPLSVRDVLKAGKLRERAISEMWISTSREHSGKIFAVTVVSPFYRSPENRVGDHRHEISAVGVTVYDQLSETRL